MEDGAWTATLFYAEVDGQPEEPALARALEELSFFSERFEILGVYPADPFRTRA
jgi:prephenate dehydratase